MATRIPTIPVTKVTIGVQYHTKHTRHTNHTNHIEHTSNERVRSWSHHSKNTLRHLGVTIPLTIASDHDKSSYKKNRKRKVLIKKSKKRSKIGEKIIRKKNQKFL